MLHALRFLLALGALTFTHLANAQQVVFLVRHADRDTNGADALTPKGHARAAALAEVLKNVSVTIVVRSDTDRTKETAAPTVKMAKAVEKVIGVGNAHVKEAYDAIRAAGAKAIVLYVGHSDTLGPLMNRLGHRGEVTLAHGDYGDLFVLVPMDPEPIVLRLRFGEK
jgi:phosphohistidine phosphatase SixA